ncbi:MAG TPA: anti-sigma factor antagonist [candidate division WOR-3 bacterium]|uniref:Anti-sigma factor antagonist n=1 Tax=candidate division WOR-3 bacterium TaxID=2052148 RepID=A0A9C9ENB8_UNCW3|nr:anti-sigma factor antagonist [candidate division WOR-3 bacterium]
MKVQAIEAIKDKKVSFFLPSGEIDEKQFEVMDKKFKSMIEAGEFNIIIDLSRVNHINYKIVGQLIDYQKKFKELGGDIKLVNVSPYLYDILRLYGFYPFEIFPSKRAALKSFM